MTYFSMLKGDKIERGSGKKVIPQEEFETLMTAQEVLEKVHEEVAAYKEEIAAEGEKEKEKARQQGFEQGLAELSSHIDKANQHVAEMRHTMQNQILPLALKAAKKIVGDQLKLHPEMIVDIVRNTIKPVMQSLSIRIFVSKEDRPFLEAKKEEIQKLLERVENFSIEEKSDLKGGGCIIETESGIINASLENQWRALEAAFEKYMKS